MGVDPMADEYPEVSSYAYCLNNPVRLIDPDGQSPTDIVYVNSDGAVTKVVKDGHASITIIDGGVKRKLSDYDISRSLFSWNNRNRQVVANVAGYYGKAVGVKVGASYVQVMYKKEWHTILLMDIFI